MSEPVPVHKNHSPNVTTIDDCLLDNNQETESSEPFTAHENVSEHAVSPLDAAEEKIKCQPDFALSDPSKIVWRSLMLEP